MGTREKNSGSIKKGQRLSPSTEFKKGQIPWSAEHEFSKETRKKISLALKGRIPWNKGKKRPPFSKEWKENISKSHRNKIYKSRGVPRLYCRGKKSNFWKGGVSTLQNKLRNSFKYKEWRMSVFTRDGFKCKICGSNKYLHAHHIKTFSKFPKLRYLVSNGITLCQKCHSKVHGRYIPNIKDFKKIKTL